MLTSPRVSVKSTVLIMLFKTSVFLLILNILPWSKTER